MSKKGISYKNFSATGGGIIYANRLARRIILAAKVAAHFRDEWEYVLWLAPAIFLQMPDYRYKVKKALGLDDSQIKFAAHEQLSINDKVYLECHNVAEKYQVFCVFDESLNIKNSSSSRTKRLLELRNKLKFRLLLSESPVSCDLLDIYSQMRFLDTNMIDITETQFRNLFMPQYVSDFNVLKRWSGPLSEKKIALVLKPYIIFKEWKQKMNVSHYDVWVELDEDEKEVYRQDKENFLRGRFSIVYMQVLHSFQYYYTICRQKVKKLQELLAEIAARKEKVIIYTKYLSEVKFLEESGILRGRKFVRMFAGTNKLKAATLFDMDYDIMICTYKVEIPILALHGCSNLIYLSQTFDYKDKAYPLTRFWSEKVCQLNIYDFWVNTELELLMKKSLLQKKNLLSNVCKSIAYGRIENL